MDPSRSPSTVGTRSRVTDFVRRMDLYPSKNRLSIKISNTTSSANDGLDASSSISPSSSPRITSKISDSADQVATHRGNRSPTFQAQWVHDMDMSVSAYGPRLSTLTADETKLCLFPRTRRRIFGLINFIHFFVGSSYAVKSARLDQSIVVTSRRRLEGERRHCTPRMYLRTKGHSMWTWDGWDGGDQLERVAQVCRH